MTSLNFLGITLFLILVAAVILLLAGIFTRRPRLWKIALGVLGADVVVYVILFFNFG